MCPFLVLVQLSRLPDVSARSFDPVHMEEARLLKLLQTCDENRERLRTMQDEAHKLEEQTRPQAMKLQEKAPHVRDAVLTA